MVANPARGQLNRGKVTFPRKYYFQHGHFIPIVGVDNERRTLIGPW